MSRTSLPPGFRFHPTDIELIMYYLKRKVMGKKLLFEVISELNIYKFSPWDLPDKSCLKSKDLEWYFFCPREKKYASGARMNRATQSGYWKTTGKDRPVHYDKNRVGMVKTLVFHQGSAPRGQRTDWVLHEYRIEDKTLADVGVAQEAYVLCKIFHKNGPGPKNGAQYGAPFNEEDWDDDNEEIPVDSLLPDAAAPGPSILALPENENSSAAMSAVDLGNASGLSLNEPGPSNDKMILDAQNNSMVTSVVDPGKATEWSLSDAGLSSANNSGQDMNLDTQDDIFYLLAAFSEDTPLFPTEHGNNEKLGDLDQGKASETVPHSDGNDLFNGLGDLSNLAELNGSGLNLFDTCDAGCTVNNTLLEDDILELNDLDAPLNFSADSFGNEPPQIGGFHRPCSFSGSEQLLAGRSCTPYNTMTGLSQSWFGGYSPGYNPHMTALHQSPVFPDSSERQGNPENSFQTGNVYNSTNAAHNLDFTYRQEEEIKNAAGNQERGVQQSIVFSRLQQLLESVPADPASAAYDGSSIHVKAEVTYRFSTCTKDALSVVLGESTFVYSCWWNLPGLEFWKTMEYCSTGSAAVFCLRFGSVFICIVKILLLMELGCYVCNWFFLCGIIGFFKKNLQLRVN